MTKDTEDLFMCLLGICISSLEKYLSKFFAHLKIEMTFHYHILRVLYICWMVSLSLSLSLSLYIYIYIYNVCVFFIYAGWSLSLYIYVCVCVCVCV